MEACDQEPNAGFGVAGDLSDLRLQRALDDTGPRDGGICTGPGRGGRRARRLRRLSTPRHEDVSQSGNDQTRCRNKHGACRQSPVLGLHIRHTAGNLSGEWPGGSTQRGGLGSQTRVEHTAALIELPAARATGQMATCQRTDLLVGIGRAGNHQSEKPTTHDLSPVLSSGAPCPRLRGHASSEAQGMFTQA